MIRVTLLSVKNIERPEEPGALFDLESLNTKEVTQMARLTMKQKRFAEEYLIDLNAAQAAIRAGYSAKTAKEIGYELLTKPHIRARVDAAIAERSRRTGVNQDRVIRELARVAFVNAYDVVNLDLATVKAGAAEDDTAAISSVKAKTIPTPEGDGVEREIRFADKIKALELLGRHLGMFNDKLDLTGNVKLVFHDDYGDSEDDHVESDI